MIVDVQHLLKQQALGWPVRSVYTERRSSHVPLPVSGTRQFCGQPAHTPAKCSLKNRDSPGENAPDDSILGRVIVKLIKTCHFTGQV